MKTLQGLVIVLKGEPITEESLKAIGYAIASTCSLTTDDDIDVTVLNAEQICNSIAGKYFHNPQAAVEIPLNGGTCKTPEDNALIYIAGLMKNVIGTPKFVPTLSLRIADALQRKSKPDAKKLLNALKILDNDYLQVSTSILEETGLTTDKIKRIRKLYHLYTDNE